MGEDDFAGVRKENAGDFIHGFIAQRAKDDDEFPAAQIFLKKDGQFARSRRIVRAIKINIGIRMDSLDASRPERSFDSLLDGVVDHFESLRLQDTNGCGCVQGVLQLKAASQLRKERKFMSARDF